MSFLSSGERVPFDINCNNFSPENVALAIASFAQSGSEAFLKPQSVTRGDGVAFSVAAVYFYSSKSDLERRINFRETPDILVIKNRFRGHSGFVNPRVIDPVSVTTREVRKQLLVIGDPLGTI